MKIGIKPYRLKLKHPFRIAKGSRTHTDVVYVRLSKGEFSSVGEASLPPYLEDSTESVIDFLEGLDSSQLTLENFQKARRYIQSFKHGNTAAKAAIEMALVSLCAQSKGVTLSEYLDVDERPILTSYTFGISTRDELATKLDEAKDFKSFKLKLGSSDDLQILKNFSELCDKPFSVDVNQGWNDFGYAKEIAHQLQEMGCLFIEQPFDAQNVELHLRLKEENLVPVFADESIQGLKDFEGRSEAFDGVVVKLMKTAGPFEAIDLMKKARAAGLKTVMGCMAESSVAIRMARAIAPLADYADLDGAFLIDDDPYKLVAYREGEVLLDA
ncbi:MAG: enolase C-terminal domain-like protein [Bacteroidota bacterium]